MKIYETIDQIIDYIVKKHKTIRDAEKHGVHGLMMLRKLNGSRMVFGEIRGFRIVDWSVFDGNILSIDSIAVGYPMKGGLKKIQQSSRLLLQDLAVINVYDHCSEFLSESGVDFAYTVNEYIAEMQHIHEWIHNEQGILRARWVNGNGDTQALLDRLSVGRKIKEVEMSGRAVDMDFDL